MTFAPVIRVLTAISEVEKREWNALVPSTAPPFIEWDWIDAMEQSGSAVPERGWTPSHLTLRRGKKLIAAAPAYLKFHSMGEYIYDFGWAHAAEQLGVEYFPKLLLGVPLSPIVAPRFLVAEGEDVGVMRRALIDAALELAKSEGCSSVHVIFPPDEDVRALEESHGFLHRVTEQYHWRNEGYATYDDFLRTFSAKRRHQLRRERAAAAEQGIELVTARAGTLDVERHGELAWQLYETTNEKHAWGHVQLTREFFMRAVAAFPNEVELVEARRAGKVIAGAFNLARGTSLYGRYWGAFEEHPFLHFNVCMYHSIDECIRLGRREFQPGAGGEHKIARGFLPTPIHSAHHIFDKRLSALVRAFVDRERAMAPPPRLR